MIQPSGLPGRRKASTKPGIASTADAHTGTEPLLAFRLWRASPASGTAAINKASSTMPKTAQAVGAARRNRRAVASAAGVPACRALPTTPQYDRSVPGTLPSNATRAAGRLIMAG